MGQQIRFKYEQKQRNQAVSSAKHLVGKAESHKSGKQSKHRSRDARPKQYRVGTDRVRINEVVSARETLGLKERNLRRWRISQRLSQQWQSGNQLDQRRVLGIHAEVATTPGAIAGKRMAAFVESC